MHPQDSEQLFAHLSEADPKQLRQVIDVLINKSRLLIHNLEETWEKLEQAEAEKTFWKESYYHLRESCQKYVDTSALAPFSYIASLEDELRKEKVYKSCLEEKFKVMHPQSLNHSSREARQFREQPGREDNEQHQHSISKQDINKSTSTLKFKDSPNETKFQSKHKIGPKNIEFFKFK